MIKRCIICGEDLYHEIKVCEYCRVANIAESLTSESYPEAAVNFIHYLAFIIKRQGKKLKNLRAKERRRMK